MPLLLILYFLVHVVLSPDKTLFPTKEICVSPASQ